MASGPGMSSHPGRMTLSMRGPAPPGGSTVFDQAVAGLAVRRAVSRRVIRHDVREADPWSYSQPTSDWLQFADQDVGIRAASRLPASGARMPNAAAKTLAALDRADSIVSKSLRPWLQSCDGIPLAGNGKS
jgi:hypothetical protein